MRLSTERESTMKTTTCERKSDSLTSSLPFLLPRSAPGLLGSPLLPRRPGPAWRLRPAPFSVLSPGIPKGFTLTHEQIPQGEHRPPVRCQATSETDPLPSPLGCECDPLGKQTYGFPRSGTPAAPHPSLFKKSRDGCARFVRTKAWNRRFGLLYGKGWGSVALARPRGSAASRMR